MKVPIEPSFEGLFEFGTYSLIDEYFVQKINF